jgi:hypothetical protein
MTIDPRSLTREQIRDLIQRQRAGYEKMENDRLRQEWREPSIEEKDAFGRLMHDVWVERQRRLEGASDRGIELDSELVVFYRKLLRLCDD